MQTHTHTRARTHTSTHTVSFLKAMQARTPHLIKDKKKRFHTERNRNYTFYKLIDHKSFTIIDPLGRHLYPQPLVNRGGSVDLRSRQEMGGLSCSEGPSRLWTSEVQTQNLWALASPCSQAVFPGGLEFSVLCEQGRRGLWVFITGSESPLVEILGRKTPDRFSWLYCSASTSSCLTSV